MTSEQSKPAGSNTNPTSEDLEASVASMARIRGCWSPSFSSDGKRLAFVSDLTGVPQVWTVPVEGGWPDLVTALEDQVMSVTWSPDGEWLAFAVAPGGGMNQQVYVARPDGTAICCVTAGGHENNWLVDWTHDGSALMVSSNRRDPECMDAYLVQPESGEWQLVAKNRGIGQLTDVGRDGQRAVLYRMTDRSDDNLFLVDIHSGAEVLLTQHVGPGSFESGVFSPDGKTIYLSSNKDRELRAFARVVLGAGGEIGPIEVLAPRDDAELEAFRVTEDGTTAALVWNVGGGSELAFIDLTTGRVGEARRLPVEIVATFMGLDFSEDGRYLALTLAGSASPPNIWVVERETGHTWQVTQGAHPGIDLNTLVRPQLVRFRAHDGLELSGWLYLPRDFHKPGPVVLSFHGGPEAQERPNFNSTYQALLSRGIAVFAPNVRGSDGFGKTFVNLDNGPLRVNAVRDIEACTNYIVGAGIGARGRLGIMGGSYGGFMTTAGLTEYPDVFAAGATLFGIVNFETFFEQTEPWMAAISKVEYGDPDTQAEMLRELSPIHRIDRISAPTLVLHGANDTNVPVVEAEQVVNSLRERGVPTEYVLFPDEGHGFRKTPNRIRSAVAIVSWFAEHLGA